MVTLFVQFARAFSTCILRDIVQALLKLLNMVALVSSFNGKSKWKVFRRQHKAEDVGSHLVIQ